MVDGEHYPPVLEDALDELAARGHEFVGAVLAGGGEKLPPGGLVLARAPVLGGADPVAALVSALREHRPDAVVDLSDEPVLDYRRRHLFASVTLAEGVEYRGPDFVFSPPPRPRLSARPALAVIGTGKRTGKTAVSAFTARALADGGIRPVVVAMGRGGPRRPQVVRGDEVELSSDDLLRLSAEGRHAASDYIEDAILARVATVGCRRCGGGLPGAVGSSNVAEGVEIANGLPGDITLLEGSGAAIPPVDADATVLVVPASASDDHIAGYFGPYRLLLADLVVVTMCEEPFGSPSRIASLLSLIQKTLDETERSSRGPEEIDVVRTVFRPTPTRSVDGAAVYVATTAPESAAAPLRRHLEESHGCRVLGMTHSLSDRTRLMTALGRMNEGADLLLCEIKAASVDVATRWATERGLDVAYLDNVPVGVGGDDPRAAVTSAAEDAIARWEAGR
ncbi:MAG TPA: 2,3-diphosphoglycerate synthetase [Actinomycetota bacterium]|nr:2,3-diphosphoglycerate synthetase [Actinomycetota bacterium]